MTDLPNSAVDLQDYTNAVSLLLSNGQGTLIDVDDYYLVDQWNWYALRRGYVVTASGGKRIRLHRHLANPADGMSVDHINGNPRDNRRRNLRICTQIENCRNTPKPKPRANGPRPTSQYKGVSRRAHLVACPWQAKIRVNNKVIHLGSYAYEDEAAAAYNMAAVQYFGRFARLNLIHESSEPRQRWNGKPRGGTSKYRGVAKSSSKRNPWYSLITHNRKCHYLGCFPTEEEAALAYNAAAARLFGDKAFLNVIPADPGTAAPDTVLP